jgi:hypothetical protein
MGAEQTKMTRVGRYRTEAGWGLVAVARSYSSAGAGDRGQRRAVGESPRSRARGATWRGEAGKSANLLSNAMGAALLANMKQTAAPEGAARVCGVVSN